MDTTYTVIGSDGQQYGPISLDQVKGWVAEHRIGPETQIMRSDTQSWLPAAQYPEIGLATAQPAVSTAAAPVPATLVAENPAIPSLRKQAISGADWFFWIAGLSLVNSFIAMSSSHGGGFVIGLGITQIIDGFGQVMGGAGRAIALALGLIVVALFGMFGFFARKGHTWSFIVGMALYGLDGVLILLVGGGLLSIGFHAFALFCIFVGLRANLQLKALLKGQPV